MYFSNPLFLLLIPLALVPFLFKTITRNFYSWNKLLPNDSSSNFLSILIKLFNSLIILFLIIYFSSPHQNQQEVTKVGVGSQIGLVLDRSASMDDPFSGSTTNDDNGIGETKSAAAARLISNFVESRKNDMIGVITFSNSAMFVLPLTQNKEAITGAVNATAGNALFQTNIGAGLTSVSELFAKVEDSGSRAVILLSDGAGRIDAPTQQKILDWFDRFDIGLYWIVLRQPGGISIFDKDFKHVDETQMPPQLELYEYFKTFRSPFQAYEAEDPESLEKAIKDINLKEKKQIFYKEIIPGKDFSKHFLIAAFFMTFLLFLLKLIEIKR
jgi:mxaC protein